MRRLPLYPITMRPTALSGTLLRENNETLRLLIPSNTIIPVLYCLDFACNGLTIVHVGDRAIFLLRLYYGTPIESRFLKSVMTPLWVYVNIVPVFVVRRIAS